jgi:hypothetical protein
LDIDSVQLLPAIAAAVTAVLPAAVIAAVERVRAGRRAHPVIHGERASLAGPSVAPGAPAQTGEPASP